MSANVAALGVVMAAAIWRGGEVERVAAVYNFVSNCLCVVLSLLFHADPRFQAAWAMLSVLFYLSLALRSTRGWTLAAASIAVVNFAMAIAHMIRPVSLWAFATGLLVWFYALNLTILAGCWTARRNGASDLQVSLQVAHRRRTGI